ncbi:MAG TPA: tRNA (adenosine(37)-N6)-threonylcarbamoyltransferase complex dimerization subunit type 1 TsaB [Gammaproteobacteria bacterium]|nr:tRNA (adenosine(37)-N6)-threonylcarbamoyltransferase complex dimerization subunit type 1 TsaB [Gammaproteobacteria bacterium]
MSRVLALETSGDIGSIALLCGDGVAERSISTPREQTAKILQHVADLLAETGLELGDLDAIAFGRGPGSFTGLRVATSVAQGFALARGVPLLPISSLAAIAQGIWRRHGIATSLVCTDARMGEVFSAEYSIREGLARLTGAEHLGLPAHVGPAAASPWAAAGDGYSRYPAELAGLTAAAALVLPDASALAIDLLPLALDALEGGRAAPLEAALPAYLRPEEAWER